MCICTSAYNSSDQSLPTSTVDGCNGTFMAFTTSNCALGASFAVVTQRKGWWQAEVQLRHWQSSSTVTLHWGSVRARFISSWQQGDAQLFHHTSSETSEAEMDSNRNSSKTFAAKSRQLSRSCSLDLMHEPAHGCDWNFRLQQPSSPALYKTIQIKLASPVRVPAISCAAAFPPPPSGMVAPSALWTQKLFPPPPPMLPCFGTSYRVVTRPLPDGWDAHIEMGRWDAGASVYIEFNKPIIVRAVYHASLFSQGHQAATFTRDADQAKTVDLNGRDRARRPAFQIKLRDPAGKHATRESNLSMRLLCGVLCRGATISLLRGHTTKLSASVRLPMWRSGALVTIDWQRTGISVETVSHAELIKSEHSASSSAHTFALDARPDETGGFCVNVHIDGEISADRNELLSLARVSCDPIRSPRMPPPLPTLLPPPTSSSPPPPSLFPPPPRPPPRPLPSTAPSPSPSPSPSSSQAAAASSPPRTSLQAPVRAQLSRAPELPTHRSPPPRSPAPLSLSNRLRTSERAAVASLPNIREISRMALHELVREMQISLDLGTALPLSVTLRRAAVLLGDTSDDPFLIKARRAAATLAKLSDTAIQIRDELRLAHNLTIPALIREAHEVLGVVAEQDSLVAQAEQLQKFIGIP
eukprot:CAMPEP_0119302580 /NCGR_PEP_ID=MMETSP1333-20130426/4156_1 /TAXON_ID=418940 /ORGANISM="Scyphosphaera apsteinii, Strain RCC1455" /LENGTH=640 /DNA_ID=CAMNT_0007304977 /DNA_START=314 /DNA_END=2236 /DNA_ORIENTATION=-